MPSELEPEFEIVTGFKPSAKMLAAIHKLVEECVRQCVDENLEKILNESLDARLETAVLKCLKQKEECVKSEVLKLRKIPEKKALALVKSYIDKHQGCRTSDIIYDLALDPELVVRMLNELKNKREIEGESQ